MGGPMAMVNGGGNYQGFYEKQQNPVWILPPNKASITR